MSEYGLSHEIVEDGCKSACVKFGGSKPNKNWGYGKFNACKD